MTELYKNGTKLHFNISPNLSGTCVIKGLANKLPDLIIYIIEILDLESDIELEYDCIVCPALALSKIDTLIIQDMSHGKRILAQKHPIGKYDNEYDRFIAMYNSVSKLRFRNETDRPKLAAYVAIKQDCKMDTLFK